MAFELKIAGNGIWQPDEPDAGQLQVREAAVSAFCPKRVPSGYSIGPRLFWKKPLNSRYAEEVMQNFERRDRGTDRRRARRKCVRRMLIVVLAALTCYTMLGLSGRDLNAEIVASMSAAVSAKIVIDGSRVVAFELKIAGNGIWQPDEPDAGQLQVREAAVSAFCPKRVPSGYSPSLRAGAPSLRA